MATRLLPAAVLLAALSVFPARAQIERIFDDNEARTQILALDEQIAGLEQQAELMIAQTEKLQTETEQLRILIEEIRGIVTETRASATQRQLRMDEIDTSFGDAIDQLEAQANADSVRLKTILEGVDAGIYTRALASYDLEGNVKGALTDLGKIIRLGELSPYYGPALYWTGAINYEQGRYDAASSALRDFIENMPGNARAPDAIFLLAEISEHLGRPDGPGLREHILAHYPASAAADRVRSREI